MATFVGVNNRVYVGPLDLSGVVNMVDFGTLTRVMQPCTTFNDGGFICVKPGLISGEASISGYQDFATGVLDDTINTGTLGTQYAITVVANPTGTVTAADPCWLSRGLHGSENPLAGAKGDMAGVEMTFPYDTAIVQAKVLHPSAARTTTGTGTAVAQTGPTAAQRLYAGLHVTAYSGLTNAVIKVQSDDASGFPSATDRITFTTVTGVTNEFASVAGSFATETHLRVSYTLTGVGSLTFVVSAGVL